MIEHKIKAAWLALLFGCVVMSGCVTSYPESESSLAFSYPLDHCNEKSLRAAAVEIAKADGPPQSSQANVCVTAPSVPRGVLAEEGAEERARLEVQAFASEEQRLREHLEQPFIRRKAAHSTLGIALSGGGSKASAFATGVLAGLSDHDLLDRADFISSVSGGGYAAYFYYAHRLFPQLRGGGRPFATNDDLYRDCIGLEYDDKSDLVTVDVREQITRVNHCDRLELESKAKDLAIKSENIRYQAYLKCSQDLLRPGACDMRTTGGLDSGISAASLLGTALTFIPSWVPNALFDWGWSTSPSARSYKDGIGLGFGATVATPGAYNPGTFQSYTRQCGPDAPTSTMVYDCRPNAFNPDPDPMRFDELRRGLLTSHEKDGQGLPFWIINAAAPKNRTSAAWLTRGREDITNSDMFEMTAVSHGSGRYGYVSASPAIHDMSVLDAVAASAAFFDGAQLVYQSPFTRTGAGLLLKTFNADWGLDIANYNVSGARRTRYKFLPFPLYYLDGTWFGNSGTTSETFDRQRSVFIRLIDGGNAENLGVYSLLKRGVKNVLISDAAQDVDGTMADICGLRDRLLNTPENAQLPRHLYVPGLAGFSSHCKTYKNSNRAYNIYGWSSAHPVMLGCIRNKALADSEPESCAKLLDNEIRLFIVKPAIDLANFVDHQLEKTDNGLVKACLVRGLPDQNPTLLNCDTATFMRANDKIKAGRCPLFPQHSTVLVTANSSGTIFTAYRELARQYTATVAQMLKDIIDGKPEGPAEFEHISFQQQRFPVTQSGNVCPPFYQAASNG